MAYEAGPFDIQHLLMQWGGKLPGGETWSCSLRLAEQVHVPGANYVPGEGEIDAWLTGAIKDAVLAYHTRANTYISPSAKLSFVKLNAIGTDGKYLRQEAPTSTCSPMCRALPGRISRSTRIRWLSRSA